MATEVSVKTAARCRPFTAAEAQSDVGDPVVGMENGRTILIDAHGQERSFDIGFSYGPETHNAQVYADMVAPLVGRAVDGYNVAVTVYGSSIAGKSHTLFGACDELGLLQMAAEELFYRVQSDQTRRFLVTVSMYQVRRESVVDLLSPRTDTSLEVQDSRSGGAVVPGLAALVVHDAEEVKELVGQGRKVVAALIKRTASRGKPHIFVDVSVRSQENGNMIAPSRSSVMRFVGTMGSGGLAVEADPGLRAFSQVVDGLAAGNAPHTLPYSDSTVTRLMQPALGGSSYAVFIGAVDPLAAHHQDTERTLEMIERVRQVRNRPEQRLSAAANTVSELREEIREARSRLELGRPGNYMNDVDPQLIARVKDLLAQLETAKADTWDARVRASQAAMEARKDNLRRAGLFIVLEEEVEIDPELMRKVDKERRNLVLQTFVVDQKLRKLDAAQARYASVLEATFGNAEVDADAVEDALRAAEEAEAEAKAGGADADAAANAALEVSGLQPEQRDELRSLQERAGALLGEADHQSTKLEKMRNNFRKYVTQLVELEERQRKTFLLANESAHLHELKDNEDWRHIESLKSGDPRLRKKLKEIDAQFQKQADEIEAAMADHPAEERQHELDHVFAHRQLREKLEELRWERDQLLGRMMERDFRHEAQMTRMQKQQFLVFRDYRRHFEEQRAYTEARYRKLVEDAVQDALHLHDRNLQLERQLKITQAAAKGHAFAGSPGTTGASVAGSGVGDGGLGGAGTGGAGDDFEYDEKTQ